MNKKYIYGIIAVVVVIVAVVLLKPSAPVTAPVVTQQNPIDYHDNIYLVKNNSMKGSYLSDFNGATLYVFDKDTAGVSNCADACAKAWPAYTSGAVAQGTFPANVSVITRADGSKQFTWKGFPLYYYSGDGAAGDVTGDGVNGVWHLVKP